MKKITKKLLTMFVICLFCLMALGSGTSKEIEKEIKTSKEDEKEVDDNLKTSLIPSIEEQVLFEQNGIKVTALEISENYLGKELKVLIENNSDINVNVNLEAIAINDYMISSWLYEDVNASKKSNATFEIFSTTLENAGIKNIGKIDLYFVVTRQDSFDVIYKTDKIEIKTSLYDQMDEKTNDIGEEILNQNGIRIVGKGVSNDLIWGNGIVLYIENNTDKNIIISTDNLSINGYMVTGLLYSSIKPEKKTIETISLSTSDLENNNIDNIKEISIIFKAYDENTFTDILTSDEINFVVE